MAANIMKSLVHHHPTPSNKQYMLSHTKMEAKVQLSARFFEPSTTSCIYKTFKKLSPQKSRNSILQANNWKHQTSRSHEQDLSWTIPILSVWLRRRYRRQTPLPPRMQNPLQREGAHDERYRFRISEAQNTNTSQNHQPELTPRTQPWIHPRHQKNYLQCR